MSVAFQKWPKISRWNSPVVITEKIDGSNAAVVIENLHDHGTSPHGSLVTVMYDSEWWAVYAQSRNRYLQVHDDNFGFAEWVDFNAAELVEILGSGRHYGEWWGSGIQRAYGLKNGERNFSLFDSVRWRDDLRPDSDLTEVVGLRRTPIILETKDFDPGHVNWAVDVLHEFGSLACNGFRRPEGVVVHFEHNQASFKAFCE